MVLIIQALSPRSRKDARALFHLRFAGRTIKLLVDKVLWRSISINFNAIRGRSWHILVQIRVMDSKVLLRRYEVKKGQHSSQVNRALETYGLFVRSLFLDNPSQLNTIPFDMLLLKNLDDLRCSILPPARGRKQTKTDHLAEMAQFPRRSIALDLITINDVYAGPPLYPDHDEVQVSWALNDLPLLFEGSLSGLIYLIKRGINPCDHCTALVLHPQKLEDRYYEEYHEKRSLQLWEKKEGRGFWYHMFAAIKVVPAFTWPIFAKVRLLELAAVTPLAAFGNHLAQCFPNLVAMSIRTQMEWDSYVS